ncbi:hypothetical protein [Haloarcula sp. JP-L23]|uniref:hypothetical protein n=1 Tax=Haloarcula sp. JP-L23 TaxID=2716717 RepID=UPI00140F3C8B|nr:hypothetical protein G9465_25030 [Haloarcula sp. JP-L23]
MVYKTPNSLYNNYSAVSGEDKVTALDGGDVPQIDKREMILRFMEAHQIPLRPKEIYGGLVAEREITFSYRTVQNKISDLRDEGLVKRVSIDADEGEIMDIPEEESGRRAYYMITQAGLDSLS